MRFKKTMASSTPIIEYKPGEQLDASKFVKNFDKLTPEAKQMYLNLQIKELL